MERTGERLTGDRLVKFINDDLLPALLVLPDPARNREAADVMRAVFVGVENRMRNGYQLRELLTQLEKVHLNSKDDIHTMAFLYESMLREVRDAAGDAGEFYTPRPVIRFMVSQVAPALGETVLDPAVGTAGFLVETLERLRPEAPFGRLSSAYDKRRQLAEARRPAVLNAVFSGVW